MRYVVLMFLCSIAFVAYVQRTGLNSVAPHIYRDVGIDTEGFAAVGSALLVGYTLMQVPAGWLADRCGGGKVLAALAIVWSSLTALLGTCTDLASMMLLWFFMGLALAGIFPCAAKLIGVWFPDTQKAMASGLLGSSTMFGLAAGSYLTSELVFRWDLSWQRTYLLYGAAGLIWALLFWALIPMDQGQPRTEQAERTDWPRLAASAPLWLLCGQQFFRAGAMIFFINWFPSFLHEARGLDLQDAGLWASRVSIAAMAGGILGGAFSDWVYRKTGQRRLSRQGIATTAMTIAAALLLASYLLAGPLTTVLLLGIAGFVATFGGVSGYTVAIEFGGRRIGTVFSLMNMAGNLGGAIVNQLVGTLVLRSGTWNTGLLLVAGIFAVDAVCWALLNPKAPLFEESHEAR